MAVSVEYRNRGFFIVHKGVVTVDEINKVNGTIHGHGEFDTHRFQVVNLLEADFSQIAKDDSEEPAATDFVASMTPAKVKVALVAADEVAVQFCKAYIDESKRFNSPWEFEIFAELDAALVWVGS